jgi:hypothetical protein
MAELCSHGIVREAERFERPAAGPWMVFAAAARFQLRITDIQVALGLGKLQRLDEIVVE